MTFFLTTVFTLLVFWRPQEWLLPWLFGFPLLNFVVGLALLSLMVEVNEGRLRIPREAAQVRLLIGLWLAAPMSHIPHTYLAGAIASIEPVFKICLFTFLMMTAIDRPSRLRTIALMFVVMGVWMAYHCHLQMTRGYGFGRLPPMWIPPIAEAPAYYRAMYFGIFSDPNDTAQFMATCIPFSFVLLRRRNVLTFLIALGISYFLVKGVLLTDSRGGQLALVAVFGTQIVLLFPHRWFPYLMFAGFAVGLALCPFSGGVLDASAHGRVVFWGLANQMFKRNPIFGIGYEMAWIVTDKGLALHNAFVTCYAELGLFGYWFWFLLIQVGVVGAWRARGALQRVADPEAQWLRRLAGQTICAMMGFCVSGYFLSRTFMYPLFSLMAMLAVIPLLARRYLPPHHPPLIDLRKDVYIRGTIGALISVVYIYITIVLLNKVWYGG